MEYEIDLSVLLSVLKKCWVWLLLIALLAGAVFGVWSETFLEDRYSSSVTFYVVNFQEGVEYSQSAVITASQYLVKDYMELIKSDNVLNAISLELYEVHGLEYTTDRLSSMISTQANSTTSLFDVTVVCNDRLLAKQIADAVAAVVPTEIDSITQKTNSVDPVVHPKLPVSRIFPRVQLIAFIAAFLAAVLSYLLFLRKNLLSSKIYTEEDIAKVYDGPVIGVIPRFDNEKGEKRA